MTMKPFLTTVVILLIIALAGGYYWTTRMSDQADGLWGGELTGDLATLTQLASAFMNTGGEERVFLVLFQNNMELRPGGGFIGSFGILKVKDGSITDFSSNDVVNFDGRIPDTVPAPYPLPETLGVKSLKLRDSNVSPDWSVNAKAAEDFYAMGKGEETLDGVIGITTNVLTSFLSVVGPVVVPGYPGEYGAETGVLDLEYQVEQAFYKQGIARGERKSIMNLLGDIILEKAKALPVSGKYELFKVVLDDLHKKDIQISFKDEALQQIVRSAGWSGEIDRLWERDYLLAVDSNLNSFKTDYRMRRKLDYTIDLSGEAPKAKLVVTYEHTAKEKDYMTKDYQSFARIYVPEGSWLESVVGAAKPAVFGSELGHKYFGAIIQVPLGTTKTVTWNYVLPKTITAADYDLLIEKQPGLNDVSVTVTVIGAGDETDQKSFILNRPSIWSALE
ncbi:MAG: DUF4012 domain-containing protein [Candidatus Moraniibacteriota bacterium]